MVSMPFQIVFRKRRRMRNVEVATFGDGLNDVCMLKGFPYSFTPANGCKEAKEAATYTLTKTGGNGAIQEGLHILKDLDLI